MGLNYYDRRVIYTDAMEITTANVISVLQDAMSIHIRNRENIVWLQAYEKGEQPILSRTKDVRSDICSKIMENHTTSIGFRMILPKQQRKPWEVSLFDVLLLDPRNTFVVRANDVYRDVVMSVTYTTKVNPFAADDNEMNSSWSISVVHSLKSLKHFICCIVTDTDICQLHAFIFHPCEELIDLSLNRRG